MYATTALRELWDHLSWAGIRKWGMCHILFKRPDALCFGGWFTPTPWPLVATHVVERFLPLAAMWLRRFPDGHHDGGGFAPHGKWRSFEDTVPLPLTFTATAATALFSSPTAIPPCSSPLSGAGGKHLCPTLMCSCRGNQVSGDQRSMRLHFLHIQVLGVFTHPTY